MPSITSKWWGYEHTFFNGESDVNYCAKLLHFNKGGHTSMHLHAGKHETLMVAKGTLTLEIIVDKEVLVHTLEEGSAWVMAPGVPHKLIAKHGVLVIIEASTKDRADDSVRIYS